MNELAGLRFGHLTVLEKSQIVRGRQRLWKCVCDCGKETFVAGGNLRSGHTKSCGCYRESGRANLHRTHGGSRSRLYEIYHGMKKRCYNPNCKAYARYGGRGITICDEWLDSFESFREWALSNGYQDNLSIDRIDNDGLYAPENCRWESSATQRRNRDDIAEIEYMGEKMCLSDAADLAGIPVKTVRKRIFVLGWSADRALSEPVEKRRKRL